MFLDKFNQEMPDYYKHVLTYGPFKGYSLADAKYLYKTYGDNPKICTLTECKEEYERTGSWPRVQSFDAWLGWYLSHVCIYYPPDQLSDKNVLAKYYMDTHKLCTVELYITWAAMYKEEDK